MTPSSSPDGWMRWAHGPRSGRLVRALGLPVPPLLDRSQHGGWDARPLQGLQVAGLQAPGGWALEAARPILARLGGRVLPAADAGSQVVVMDATGCRDADTLRALRDGMAPALQALPRNARMVVLAADPDTLLHDPLAAAAARGTEGFVRSVAKEIGRKGATANLLRLHPDAPDRLAAPLAFLCSSRSCFVSGQVLRIDSTVPPPPSAATAPLLAGRLALVTGAAQGLGAAMAQRLAQDGAHVLCADVPAAAAALQAVAQACGGTALPLDVTAPDAVQALLDAVRQQGANALDVLVHNAGITRDKTLARMNDAQWDAVLEVNFGAIARLDAGLDAAGALARHARSVYLSSVSGIAGNVGQSNYATSKAALIAYVQARARQLADSGGTANALAPGFIETGMTHRIPFLVRQAGRRLSSLSQGGLPADVAEAVAFLTRPDAHGISGQTLRVCGQALIGA